MPDDLTVRTTTRPAAKTDKSQTVFSQSKPLASKEPDEADQLRPEEADHAEENPGGQQQPACPGRPLNTSLSSALITATAGMPPKKSRPEDASTVRPLECPLYWRT